MREEEEQDLEQLSKIGRTFQERTPLVLLGDFMPWLKFALKKQMKQVCRIHRKCIYLMRANVNGRV